MIEWSVSLSLSVAGSLVGLLVASTLLFFEQDVRTRVVPWLVSYAVGTLLGAALLDLVPEALESLEASAALGTLLSGILTFFILEKLVLWRHSHDDDDHHHVHPGTVPLVIIGDTLHTFVDGIVIAAATLTSVPLGVTTALAVAMHEIPQEAGDFAILLAAGQSRRRAVLLNIASAIGGVLGAALMLLFGSRMPDAVPYVLAFAGGNMMYVAMSDLIPSLNRGRMDSGAWRQIVLVVLGIVTMALL